MVIHFPSFPTNILYNLTWLDINSHFPTFPSGLCQTMSKNSVYTMHSKHFTYLDIKLHDSSQYVTLPEKTTTLYRIPANTTKLYKKSCKKMSNAVKICRIIGESLLLCQTLSKVWGFLS